MVKVLTPFGHSPVSCVVFFHIWCSLVKNWKRSLCSTNLQSVPYFLDFVVTMIDAGSQMESLYAKFWLNHITLAMPSRAPSMFGSHLSKLREYYLNISNWLWHWQYTTCVFLLPVATKCTGIMTIVLNMHGSFWRKQKSFCRILYSWL